MSSMCVCVFFSQTLALVETVPLTAKFMLGI